MAKGDRSFTVVNVEGALAKKKLGDIPGGRYMSQNPAAAAKKAASKLFKKIEDNKEKNTTKKSTVDNITFTIRETTAGSDKKEFKYIAERKLLKKPIERVINGVTITYMYDFDVKAK